MKLAVAFLFLGSILTANAFLFGGLGGGAAYPPSQFYQTLLENQLTELLATPGFPEDLQQRAIDTVENAKVGFEQCNSTALPMPWMQKVCITRQYAVARSGLTAIENEAVARAQASTAAPATGA